MAKWPAYLPEFWSAEDYAETWMDGVSRTEMSVGPAKTRRRFTRMRRTLRRSFVLRASQYADFWNYIDVDLAGGVASFDINHPLTGTPMTLKLAEPPQFAALGIDAFTVTLVCEEQ